jgi:hypothetical protein
VQYTAQRELGAGAGVLEVQRSLEREQLVVAKPGGHLTSVCTCNSMTGPTATLAAMAKPLRIPKNVDDPALSDRQRNMMRLLVAMLKIEVRWERVQRHLRDARDELWRMGFSESVVETVVPHVTLMSVPLALLVEWCDRDMPPGADRGLVIAAARAAGLIKRADNPRRAFNTLLGNARKLVAGLEASGISLSDFVAPAYGMFNALRSGPEDDPKVN